MRLEFYALQKEVYVSLTDHLLLLCIHGPGAELVPGGVQITSHRALHGPCDVPQSGSSNVRLPQRRLLNRSTAGRTFFFVRPVMRATGRPHTDCTKGHTA